MIDDEEMRARITAAETWLYLERSCPGGTKTVAWRVLPHRRRAFAENMAKILPADAGSDERKAYMFAADDRGDHDIRSVNASTNVKVMTAEERLAHANKIAGLGKFRPLKAEDVIEALRKRREESEND